MEAAILSNYPGVHLPERWIPGPGRNRSGPSLRRVLVMVRHLPAGSALERAVHPATGGVDWGVMHQLVDDVGRRIAGALGVKEPAAHPLSPHNKKRTGVLTPERRAVLAAAKARAEAHNNR